MLLYIVAAFVSLASAQTIGELSRKVAKTWRFKGDQRDGKIKVGDKQSWYLADYTNGYSNPRFDHCAIVDCIKEERCTDFGRYMHDHNGEETECTMQHYHVEDACFLHSRLNTYDYYQQWWFTLDTTKGVNVAVVQCWQAY